MYWPEHPTPAAGDGGYGSVAAADYDDELAFLMQQHAIKGNVPVQSLSYIS